MRSFRILLGVTVLAVAGAIALEPSGRQAAVSGSGTIVSPELKKNINAVTSFTIAAKGTTLTVLRGKSGWVMKEKDGYAVDPVKAKSLLVGIAELKISEPKTRKPDLYARIGVEPVTAKEAKSRLITVTGPGGKVLTKLIIGKTKEARAGIGPGSVYYRRPGAKRAWLAAGNLSIEVDPLKWLVRRLADVKRGRIRQIILTQGDGKKTIVGRDKPGEEIKLLTTPLPEASVPLAVPAHRAPGPTEHGRQVHAPAVLGVTEYHAESRDRRGECKVRRGHYVVVPHRVAEKPAPAAARVLVPQFDEEQLRALAE